MITNDVLKRAVDLGIGAEKLEPHRSLEIAKEAMRQKLSAAFRDALALLITDVEAPGVEVRRICEHINDAMNAVERL